MHNSKKSEIEYIIVQAGGKGNRLDYLTANKPKALVPIDNLPLLFHLFNRFPDKRFIIIGDYKQSVLREYLRIYANVQYLLVKAKGQGTLGGLDQALALIPAESPFMLIWSDILLDKSFELPNATCNYVGISGSFSCRWRYQNGAFLEKSSSTHGVAGLFIFTSVAELVDLPSEGEFVRYLSRSAIAFSPLSLPIYAAPYIATRLMFLRSKYWNRDLLSASIIRIVLSIASLYTSRPPR